MHFDPGRPQPRPATVASGLGDLHKRYYLETAAVFAGLVTIILIGLIVENGIFRTVEERTIRRWGMTL
jgi:NitT/TauT family transport system permease protein